IPPAFLGASTGFLSALEETLNSYLRGQISLSLWIFILDSILLSAFTDLDSWLILSLIAGFTEIIPVVGPTIALVIGCVVALVEGGGDAFVRVAIIFTFVQIVENQVLVPRIMGKELDVHPLTVMFFLLAGGILGGVVGALLSLPVAATLKVMLQQYYPGFVKRIEALLVDEPVPSAVLVLPRGVEALPHAGGVIAAKTPEGPVLLIPDGPAEKKPDGGIIVPGHGYSDEGERG
ncbi:MAG TPA: AI-2E family transporter, partial [bacterium]|nr:AI-2E family transporter [bacterium]